MLLMKLTHALDKHAHQEEMVVYPALREANEAADADTLEGEHGYIKTCIYELNEMGPDAPTWLEMVREFRDARLRACPDGGGAGLPALQAERWTRSRTTGSRASSTATASGWLLADQGQLRRLLDARGRRCLRP